MKKKTTKRFLSMLLALVLVFTGIPATVFAADSIDVGLYAAVSTDYCSSWENVNGINNPAFEPTSSNNGTGKGWGNWSQEEGSVHWVQYDWDSAITTDTFQVYWYDDGGGTRIPSEILFQYKDGNGQWKDMTMVTALDDVLKLNQYNTIKVESVTTTAIRFNNTVREGAAANGLYRWKVLAEATDDLAELVLDYAKESLSLAGRLAADTELQAEGVNGVEISWAEDHKALEIKNGTAVVTRGASDVSGKVTATLSFNGKTATKEFTVVVPAQTDAIPDMLAKYEFSDLSGSLSAGSTIVDLSGHDNNASVVGNGVSAANDALVLTGNGYVQLPTGMFDNQNNLTISMWVQNDMGAAWTSAFFFGRGTTSYFMINPQNPTTQTTKMCITWGGSGSEIGLAPGNNLSDGPYTGSGWTHYIAVITPNSITGYINGEKYNTYELNNTVSQMGTNLTSYIGRSEYGDPYFKGKLKNVSVYSKAVTDAEAGALYTEGLTAEEILKNAAEALEIPEVKGGNLSTALYDSLTLETSLLSGLVEVDWATDNAAVIAEDGKVTAPEENTAVTLTATLKIGDTTYEKEITVVVLTEDATSYSITLDVNDAAYEISDQMFGLFYEDINSAADGGLASELVKNNSFENYYDVATPNVNPGRGDQASWKNNWTSSNGSNFTVERTDGLNANNTNYAKITGNMTLSNNGFVRRNAMNAPAISIKNNASYDFDLWMKAEASYAGKITAKVVNSSGTALTDEVELTLKKDGTWQKLDTVVLKGKSTGLGKLVLTFNEAAVSDVIYIDMVSLNPQDTYGYGNKNYAHGAGLRKDLVESLLALSPSFIRFPGGCVIEGDMGVDGFYDWENSVGTLEERKATANYWSKTELNDYVSGYGYMMSYEFGFHEILTLCEEIGAEAFPILSAGIFCQFRNSADPFQVGDPELDEFAMKAIHLLDYCWGDPDSEDEQEATWAAKRVANGHEEPFDLKYVGIGNENWNEGKVNYYANFEYMKEMVEEYAEKQYPERSITIISSTGPYATGSAMDNAWRWIDSDMPGETLVDEHYYVSLNWMLENTHRYDYYDRLDEGGSNVFVGEYAVNSSINTLEAAIAEAAYMTGFERNGDIVRHASYAPLLCKNGCNNWSPNLIYFDEDEVMYSANYYTQLMYSNNYGNMLLNTDLSKMNSSTAYEALPGTQTDIYQVASMDDDFIYLKLINHDEFVKDITINVPGVDEADVEFICLTGAADAVNSFGNEVVAPESTVEKVEDGKVIYNVPAMSFTVVKVAIGNQDITVEVNKKALQEAIDNAVPAEDAETYTEDTWAAYAEALEAAKAVLVKEDATQAEVNEAVRNLANAKAELEEIKEVKDGNLALSAKTEATYNTSWNKGDTAVNDGENQIPDVTNANPHTWGTWGNTGASETITLTWDAPVVIESSTLYIWDDNPNDDYIGIDTPASYVYEYLPQGSDEWVTLLEVTEGIEGSAVGAENSVTFEEPVTAVALRCTLNKKLEEGTTETNAGVGLVEWEVYGTAAKLELPYVDVAEEDWFYDAVYFNYFAETMTGMDPTHFGPFNQLSRAQFALILYRIEGEPEAAESTKSFKDIAGDEWYGPAVLWAAEVGIVKGYESGYFGPGDNITREQMALMMYRYADYLDYDTSKQAELDAFADAGTISPFATDAIKWANGMSIITGKENGTKIDPQGNTARCEAAAIIQRFIEAYAK